MRSFFIITDPKGGIFCDSPYSISIFTTEKKARDRAQTIKIKNLKVEGPISIKLLKERIELNEKNLVIYVNCMGDGVPSKRIEFRGEWKLKLIKTNKGGGRG